jgi:hypothetical protein
MDWVFAVSTSRWVIEEEKRGSGKITKKRMLILRKGVVVDQ